MVDNPEPTTLTKEESDKYFGFAAKLISANSRAQASRSRSPGRRPVKTTRDYLESIKPEVLALAEESERA